MNIQKVIEDLDKLFEEKKIGEVEQYLKEQIFQAKEEGDSGAVLTLLNEQIGYYRSISHSKASLDAFCQAKELIKDMGLMETAHEATTLLNGATALRAAGELKKAMEEYKRVEEIYKVTIPQGDFRFAGLYNNMSILYSELEEYEQVTFVLLKALEILKGVSDSEIEQAITYTNLALNYGKLGQSKKQKEYLNKALTFFKEYTDNKDGHYAASLSALAGAYFEAGEMMEAAKLYQTVCEDIRSYFGENMSYVVSLENLAVVYRTMGDLDQAEILVNEAERVRQGLGEF